MSNDGAGDLNETVRAICKMLALSKKRFEEAESKKESHLQDADESDDEVQEEVKEIFIFKIYLNEIKPLIWRRIEVPTTFNFKNFHYVIQNAMGWNGAHLHEFRVENFETQKIDILRLPDPPKAIDVGNRDFHDMNDYGQLPKTLSEKRAKLATYFKKPGDSGIYMYDFGDLWEHSIILESIQPAKEGKKYPRCINGQRACPPEDVGGFPGYKEFLGILSNPSHKEFQEKKEWLAQIGIPNFDPKKFDVIEVNNHMEEKKDNVGKNLVWNGFCYSDPGNYFFKHTKDANVKDLQKPKQQEPKGIEPCRQQ